MTVLHHIKLLIPRFKWFVKRKKIEKQADMSAARLYKLIEEAEVVYNEGYRKNPTEHKVLELSGRIAAYREILYGDKQKR